MFISLLQLLIALGIYNVWLLRANRATPYRGANAQNMREEFLAYGLPLWFMELVRGLKLSCATLLVLGIWYPSLTVIGAIGLTIMMFGAVAMHAKVGDEVRKTLPAAGMLVLCLVVVAQALLVG